MAGFPTGSPQLQTLRYLLVGGFAFVAYFGILALLFEILRLPHGLAVGAAYLAAVAIHFFSNRSFTFRANEAAVATQGGRYIGLVFLNFAIQLAVVYLAYDVAGWNFYLSNALGIVATLVTGFLLMKSWVFAHPVPEERGP